MKRIVPSILLLVVLQVTVSLGQNSSILRGVYLFGRSWVNLQQMHDTLGLNTIQTATGYDNAWDNIVLNNTVGIKLYNLRPLLSGLSAAQRMEYEAENTSGGNGIQNYFAEHQTGYSYGYEWAAIVGTHSAGYMIKNAQPGDEYHYGQTQYTATFKLRIPPQGTSPASANASGNPKAAALPPAPPSQVATCEVWVNNTLASSLTTYPSNFSSSGYKDAVLSFTVPRGGAPPVVDLRVYWYAKVTTYVDKVIVQDTAGARLFAGVYDAMIRQEALTFGNLSTHEKFYLVDEPYISAFMAFRYVGDRIKAALGASNPNAGSVAATYYALDRFLATANPYQLMLDNYFLTSDVPHPSVTDAAAAQAYGFQTWDPATYVSRLQSRIDDAALPSIRVAAVASQNRAKPWVFIPQLHGFVFWQTHKYRDLSGNATLRPPSPAELRMASNLAFAYGAKGLLPYPYGTDYWWADEAHAIPVAFPGLVSGRMANGYYMDHWKNIDTVYGQSIWTGYREKWDELKSINSRLMRIGDTLLALTWNGAKTWSGSQTASGQWSNIVTGVGAMDLSGNPQTPVYVETGHLRRSSGTDYLIVVNRRCAPGDLRYISPVLQKPGFGTLRVTNIETNSTWNIRNGTAFTEMFNPGEGKIYRIEGFPLYVGVSGPTYLGYSQNGTFTASVLGGTPPYTYQWWREYTSVAGGDPVVVAASKLPVKPMLPPPYIWFPVGTNSPTVVLAGQISFAVKCVVTDSRSNTLTSNILYVTVGSAANLAAPGAEGGNPQNERAAGPTPTDYSLDHAYPNPFNPTTQLRFALPAGGLVALNVYDALGRDIKLLANGFHEAGYHTVAWDASSMASGVYFVRLTVFDERGTVKYSNVRKLLLMK